MSKKQNIIVLVFGIILFMLLFCGGAYLVMNQSKKGANDNQNFGNSNDKLALTKEDRFKALYYINDFSDINNVTTKDMIRVVGMAIYDGIIDLEGTKINEQKDGTYEGISYSEDDIKNAVYNIFGVKIIENISADSLIYQDGKYILNPADGGMIPTKIRKLTTKELNDAIEYSYDLYCNNFSTEETEKMGSYKVVIDANNNRIKSKQTQVSS